MPFEKNLIKLSSILIICLFSLSCSVAKAPFTLSKNILVTSYKITKFTTLSSLGTAKVVYNVGKFSFTVVQAPMDWPLIHGEINSVDGIPPKKAIKQGRIKRSPYEVNGRRYVPMSMQEAETYRQVGIASWYGFETLKRAGGHMTANGEVFDPNQYTAAHKYLPLPCFVRVTNLNNSRSIIVRVNDRGPFVSGRIIDLSSGAAKKLRFYRQGTTRVLVETVQTLAEKRKTVYFCYLDQ